MSEIYVPKVRPYTAEEAREIERQDDETVENKMTRRTRTHEIDVDRYDEAAAQHPDLQEHMERMKAVSAAAIEGWRNFYGITEAPKSEDEIYRGYVEDKNMGEVEVEEQMRTFQEVQNAINEGVIAPPVGWASISV